MLKAACKAWDDAVEMGENMVIECTGNCYRAYRNIGLVMDCDTTVLNRFCISEIQKLSGGGYFKIINHQYRCLKNLGYTEKETDRNH
jgi:ribonucleoside-diphosphate reductase alpha chain